MVKASLFWQLSVEERRSNDGEGLVRATVVIDPITRQHANITVQVKYPQFKFKKLLPVKQDLPICFRLQLNAFVPNKLSSQLAFRPTAFSAAPATFALSVT
jgi:hypothetical protein